VSELYPIQVVSLAYCSPLDIFQLFHAEHGAILLHSAMQQDIVGRYSYIAVDPFDMITVKNGDVKNVLDILQQTLATYTQSVLPDLPPFQGGMAGVFAYEAYQYVEDFHIKTYDDMHVPDIALGLYDIVFSFDHLAKKAWLISTGFPEIEPRARLMRAKQRMAHYLQRIQSLKQYIPKHHAMDLNIISNFTKKKYMLSVQAIIDYILAGDIFEANLSQRFETMLPKHFSAWDCYVNMQQQNPAPFSAYLNLKDMTIISASPERFVKLSDRHVETRPIKGTRARGQCHESDQSLAYSLKNSAKDNAENIMIVDLLRNDLSKVCENHSVQVTQLCDVETYATVHHLVSVITGTLKSQYNALDLLWALFPGGSITGAPKIRAMQIIAEIEEINRGIYCGAIGFIGFNGEMDTSIAIRTATLKNDRIYFQAGGAVVSDSSPISEYEETLTKSSSFRRVLTSRKVVHDFIDR
jgi:para-aminobenzoate synthetase component 1